MNSTMVRVVVGALFTLGLLACGGSGGGGMGGGGGSGGSGGGTGSTTSSTSSGSNGNVVVRCDFSDSKYVCIETVYDPGSGDVAKQSCTANGGKVVDACPTANLLGKCQNGDPSMFGSNAEYYYSGGELTADQAQMACTQSTGTWSAQ